MENDLDYTQFYPKSEILKRYIKVYYLQCASDPALHRSITYYPNYTTTLNIYKNAKVSSTKFSRTHEPDSSNTYLQLLVSKIDRSREIVMKGPFQKLTIVFNPLGINRFLSLPLSTYTREHFSFFNAFGQSFAEVLDKIFLTNKIDEKRDLLDDYLLLQFREFKVPKLQYAVDQLFETNGEISVQQIAQEIKVSRKTILRLFKNHLSYSPTEYKNILKFRNALDVFQQQINKPNLSTLAYEALYYDQSDMNFHFRAKTGRTPKQLFSDIQTINKGLYWKMTDVPKVQD